MMSLIVTSSPLRVPFHSHKLCWSKTLSKQVPAFLLPTHTSSFSVSERGLRSLCFFNSGDNSQAKESGLEWPILRRWEVPWQWQTVPLTSLACALGFVLTGLVEATAVPYLGIQFDELTLDEKAGILFVDQSLTTAVVLGVLYGIANAYQPLPEDFFKYDWREPFNFEKGWLLWAGVGLAGALIAIAVTGAAMSFFSGETPERGNDTLVTLLPLIGSSNVSTACLVGITGVLAPLLEETVFQGFFMASLTKWDCFGDFICSNSQPSYSHHYSCFLELRNYITSYFSSASRL
ncbi:uncharacterized protein LOC113868696 isoform X2 [Abrus precatorius]|uniref:Uncharacterized protein LOC113868696 isoform X2 n=1 Tax=Abrus precatorius TaxID=3816 RepID=A0A8B8LX99_ABRPR|nr:uncharacterized protein LOC113868696 isoform X2 [Abrus precatorius]